MEEEEDQKNVKKTVSFYHPSSSLSDVPFQKPLPIPKLWKDKKQEEKNEKNEKKEERNEKEIEEYVHKTTTRDWAPSLKRQQAAKRAQRWTKCLLMGLLPVFLSSLILLGILVSRTPRKCSYITSANAVRAAFNATFVSGGEAAISEQNIRDVTCLYKDIDVANTESLFGSLPCFKPPPDRFGFTFQQDIRNSLEPFSKVDPKTNKSVTDWRFPCTANLSLACYDFNKKLMSCSSYTSKHGLTAFLFSLDVLIVLASFVSILFVILK